MFLKSNFKVWGPSVVKNVMDKVTSNEYGNHIKGIMAKMEEMSISEIDWEALDKADVLTVM